MKTVLVINTNQMGHGDNELGQKLLTGCLGEMSKTQNLQAVILYNNGVKLLAEGSPFVSIFHHLIEDGVDVLPCGTCCAYYQVKLGVGEVSDMPSIVKCMDKADKVITL